MYLFICFNHTNYDRLHVLLRLQGLWAPPTLTGLANQRSPGSARYGRRGCDGTGEWLVQLATPAPTQPKRHGIRSRKPIIYTYKC